MLVIGVIAEYNPFHNGHRYHLNKARQKTGADAIICVLSGNFTQRGEPAIVNKWARTRMALQEGADVVFELPVVYATQHAQGFASGAVKLLEATGVVDYLVFGSEHGEIRELQALAQFLLEEPEPYRERLKSYLAAGFQYPAARAASLVDYHSERGIPGLEHLPSAQVYSLIRHPNNILGLEYLQVLREIGSSIRPLAVRRVGAGYNHPDLGRGKLASAKAIRRALLNPADHSQIPRVMPDSCWHILREELAAGRGPVFLDTFSPQLLSLLRRADLSALRQINGVREGLEHRLQKTARKNGTIEALLRDLKTKRYTRTRLQRLLLHLLFNFTHEDAELFSPHTEPCYLRLLGFSPRGQKLLQHVKKRATVPLITKPARHLTPLIRTSPRAARMWQLECLATDLYVLGYPNPAARKAGQDHTQSPVIV